MPEGKIGQMLIDNKLINSEQLRQALEMQQMKPTQPIGQVLCQLGFLSAEDLEHVLDDNGKRRKLGEILISQNLINEERLNNALKISTSEKIPLGKALIKQHVVQEEQVARAIATQHDMAFVTLSGIAFQTALSGLINATYAQRLRIVPIELYENILTVATTYPLQREEVANLQSCCKMKIKFVIAKESDIIIAQQKVFKLNPASSEEFDIELSEDPNRETGKSKYVREVITGNVNFLVKEIITTGILREASDIHLETTRDGMTIRYRLDGMLQTVDTGANEALISANARQIVSKIKIMCDMDIAERRRPQDSSFKMKVSNAGKARSVDFRISTVPTQFGENVVIRILDKRQGDITLEGLGYFPEEIAAIYKALQTPTGIFVVTGPTGSGKSSSLYAMLSHINTPDVKILTIEDPIERTLEGITQTEVNETIGNTFARMLRAFLRQDPDIIMVGEIRDLDTATISMRAALTGHMVLTTLHTNDVTSAVTRLVDMGVEPSLISTTLRSVLAQRLVRHICRNCTISYTPTDELLAEFGIPEDSGIHYVKGRGCPMCNYTGFNGRKPILELWIPTREELLLINRRPNNLSLRDAVFSVPGRETMIENGFRRVLAGETTLEELLRVVPYEQVIAGRGKIARLGKIRREGVIHDSAIGELNQPSGFQAT